MRPPPVPAPSPVWVPANSAEFWTMCGAIATILAFLAAGYYAYLTYNLFRVTKSIFEREDRPLLRLSAVNISDPHAKPALVNMGRGVALTAVITQGQTLVRFLWTIPSQDRKHLQDLKLERNTTYSIYYQDIAAQWYVTEGTLLDHRTQNRFLGKVAAARVPKCVTDEAQVIPV